MCLIQTNRHSIVPAVYYWQFAVSIFLRCWGVFFVFVAAVVSVVHVSFLSLTKSNSDGICSIPSCFYLLLFLFRAICTFAHTRYMWPSNSLFPFSAKFARLKNIGICSNTMLKHISKYSACLVSYIRIGYSYGCVSPLTFSWDVCYMLQHFPLSHAI